jgi:hypothetical protein
LALCPNYDLPTENTSYSSCPLLLQYGIVNPSI